MSKGFKDKHKKFHPVHHRKGVRRKRSGKSIIPKLELRLPERKETFSEIKSNIQRDANLRDSLIEKNEGLADKISLDKESEFNESRREQLKENNKVIKQLNGDIKKNINKLSKDEKAQLPDDVKNLRRFL